MELRGKTALLTGATGGLGRAIAGAMAAGGTKLVLSSRKAEELERLADELPGEHRVEVADLAEPGAAVRLCEAAGAVDILVANAALPASGNLDGFTQAEVERALRVNFESPVLMAHSLVPKLAERGSGHVVMIGSLSGVAATARQSLYNGTKFGLRGFTLALREDMRGSGVGVSLVEPGFVREAGMFADSGANAPAGLGTTTPQKVAAAVVGAIEKNRGEVTVAPFHQIRLAKFAGSHPELAGRLSGKAATQAADKVARGQAEKR